MTTTDSAAGPVLLIGASRGLGLALAQEWADRGRPVVATVRGSDRTALHDLADRHDGIEVEHVDVTAPDQVGGLRRRLDGRRFEILFVNAGIGDAADDTVAGTSVEDFVQIMVTNALSPLRVVEALQDLVTEDGTIGVMSSGQGSVTNNVRGGHEVYRGSKAALNTFMRSYAARHRDDRRSLVLMAPGWVRTKMGGEDARYGIDESIPGVVSTIDALRHDHGLRYVDFRGETVPW